MTGQRARVSAEHRQVDVLNARDRHRLSGFGRERTSEAAFTGRGSHRTTRSPCPPLRDVVYSFATLSVTVTALSVGR